MPSTLKKYYDIACAQKRCKACAHFVTEILKLDFDEDSEAPRKYARMMRGVKRHVVNVHINIKEV
jgi:hypothetical protein